MNVKGFVIHVWCATQTRTQSNNSTEMGHISDLLHFKGVLIIVMYKYDMYSTGQKSKMCIYKLISQV